MSPDVPWPWICVLVGAGILIFGVIVRRKLKASESWPKTSGIILDSTTQPGWAKIGGERLYVVEPKVIYEYRADGKTYTSSRLALVEINTANEALARAKAEKYEAGQEVVVHYNPRKPDFATLQVGDPTGGKLPFGIIILGSATMITGIIWLLSIER